MKKLLVIATSIVWLSNMPIGWAASTATATVEAHVNEQTSLQCAVVRCTSDGTTENCSTSAELTNDMDFGPLVNSDPTNPNSALMGDHFFKVFCGANTSSRPFTITQTSTSLGLPSGATIPDNCWVFSPITLVDTTDSDTTANEACAECTFGTKVSAASTDALWINTNSRTDIVVA